MKLFTRNSFCDSVAFLWQKRLFHCILSTSQKLYLFIYLLRRRSKIPAYVCTGCFNSICSKTNTYQAIKNALLRHENRICTFLRCRILTYEPWIWLKVTSMASTFSYMQPPYEEETEYMNSSLLVLVKHSEINYSQLKKKFGQTRPRTWDREIRSRPC